MQPFFSPENHFLLHNAANSLFYKSPSVLLTFGHFSGQKKCPFLKNFLTLFFIFFCLKNFREYSYKNTKHGCSQVDLFDFLRIFIQIDCNLAFLLWCACNDAGKMNVWLNGS